jgi:hypothetical protein
MIDARALFPKIKHYLADSNSFLNASTSFYNEEWVNAWIHYRSQGKNVPMTLGHKGFGLQNSWVLGKEAFLF